MATFQIHEDIENIHSKLHCKKVFGEHEGNKITKKKFGENNSIAQPFQKNGLKEVQLAYLGAKNEKDKAKKAKILIEDTTEQSEEEEVVNLVEESFLKFDNKENVEADETLAVKTYCPFSVLHNEYGEDIYNYLREMEENGPRAKSAYMLKQMDLNWNSRAILVDWLVSVSDEYELSHETLHLSVNYIDRFLSSICVVRNKFQLVGAAAMRLASKLEEYQPFDAKEWAYLTGDSFTPRQILKMEQIILKVLGFKMKSPTVCDFIQHLSTEYKLDEKTIHLAFYISELVLLEGDDYLEHFPSKLAAASVALARFNLSKPNLWPARLKKVSGYTLKELSPVVQRQHKTLEDSPMKDQKAIATKYKSSKYHRVALMKPRALALEYFET